MVRSETTHGELRAVGLETFEDERTDHLHKAVVNEKAVEKSNLEKDLQEGDKISIMPFVAGG